MKMHIMHLKKMGIEIKTKPDYVLGLSNEKISCSVIVCGATDVIRRTPIILKKFRFARVDELKNWLHSKWPNTRFEIRPSPTQWWDEEIDEIVTGCSV